MARYILIDSNSGYIWGDSADLGGKIFEGNAIQFARALDAWIGTNPNEQDYELLNRPPCDTETGCLSIAPTLMEAKPCRSSPMDNRRNRSGQSSEIASTKVSFLLRNGVTRVTRMTKIC